MDLERNLFNEMMKDRIVIEYLKDKDIAVEFYGALCNVDWYPRVEPIPDDERIMNKLKGVIPRYWSCSWRTAGGYIADIRNIHHNTTEDYMDFYCAGNEGTVTDLVRECFDRMGWFPEGELERE